MVPTFQKVGIIFQIRDKTQIPNRITLNAFFILFCKTKTTFWSIATSLKTVRIKTSFGLDGGGGYMIYKQE